MIDYLSAISLLTGYYLTGKRNKIGWIFSLLGNLGYIYILFNTQYNNRQYFIEYDGIQHFEFNSFFFKTFEEFENQQRRDKVLEDFCELHKDKVTLIRFKYDQNDEEIINKLKKTLNE